MIDAQFGASIMAVLVSLSAAALRYYFRRSTDTRVRRGDLPNFREKMQRLSEDLLRASAEVDKTLEQIASAMQAREEAVASLDAKLDELSAHEQELQRRVETLESVSLPAVEYFVEMTEKGERRSASRDYVLFGAGVVASTVITIMLRVVFSI